MGHLYRSTHLLGWCDHNGLLKYRPVEGLKDRGRLWKRGTGFAVQRQVTRPLPRRSVVSEVPLGNMRGLGKARRKRQCWLGEAPFLTREDSRALPLTHRLAKSLLLPPGFVCRRNDGGLLPGHGLLSSELSVRAEGEGPIFRHPCFEGI